MLLLIIVDNFFIIMRLYDDGWRTRLRWLIWLGGYEGVSALGGRSSAGFSWGRRVVMGVGWWIFLCIIRCSS
jgi:hypothetical protein